jgi:adenylosuccinate lyase
MPVCPIDSGRYGSKEMVALFEEENRLQRMLDVEVALAESLAELGEIPRAAPQKIRRKARVSVVTPERVKEREQKTRHDIMAMVEILAEEAGEYGKYVHWGATSYDIVDTAWTLIMRDGIAILERRLEELTETLCEIAEKHRGTIMVGRTHGQHATPITFGFKISVYAAETARNLGRLKGLEGRLLVGKMSGATGTMASQGAKALETERLVMRKLGLKAAEISTQVLCRDRLAEFVSWAAITASGLDRISTEIRNLQRTEINEAAEGFETSSQVGSSTMPHKQNPIDCEKVSGLAKVLRGNVVTALENIPLWHERDLTDSSSERFLVPLTFIILDEMLLTMTRVMKNLRVFPEQMKRNLGLTGGAILTEAVMMALARKGMGRQKAHELMRGISAKAAKDGRPLKDQLLESREVTAYLSRVEIESLMKPENYLGHTGEIISRTLKYARQAKA